MTLTTETRHDEEMSEQHPREAPASAELPRRVEYWSTEEIHSALDSGDLSDWRAIVHAMKRDPFGRTSRQVEEVIDNAEIPGISTALREILVRARQQLEAAERAEVARDVVSLLNSSGLSEAEFASRIGIPADMLEDYLSGDHSPPATLLVRMRRVAHRFGKTRPRG